MRKRTKRVFVLTFALASVLLLAWVVSVIPRVADLKKRNRKLVVTPQNVWTPPQGESAIVVDWPDTTNIDWQRLSPNVDNDGVYIVDYDAAGQRGVSGKHRNPYNIATFAIYQARQFLRDGDPNSLRLVMRQIDYVVKSARLATVAGDSTLVWCGDFDLGYQYNAQAPWPSSYFQIRCVDVLLWASWLTGDKLYDDMAENAMIPLAHDVTEGGVSFVTADNGLFFQEVVTAPLHHILNGHLTTLIGVHSYARYTNSAAARDIFERGVRGTIEFLPEYDKRGYSLYSRSPNPGINNHFNIANPQYHHLHVAQLRTLYAITENEVFKEYADKWERKGNGVFDALWTATWVMFKDAMRLKKAF